MLKIQSAIKVLAKSAGQYTSQSGSIVPTYSVATISEGRAENVDVSADIFNKVEEGRTYIFGGDIGSTKYGKYWSFKEVVKDITDEKEKK